MGFSKRFPRVADDSAYPKWVEVSLTENEEVAIEKQASKENVRIFSECIADAEAIAAERKLKPYQTDIISIAVALFDKRASHSVYHKERKCKDKFDSSA